MVPILDDDSKIGYSRLFQNKGIRNNGYDVKIPAQDLTNKILSRNSDYNVDVVMWPKVGNSSISVKEVVITSIL